MGVEKEGASPEWTYSGLWSFFKTALKIAVSGDMNDHLTLSQRDEARSQKYSGRIIWKWFHDIKQQLGNDKGRFQDSHCVAP